jgi:hypothetical protein
MLSFFNSMRNDDMGEDWARERVKKLLQAAEGHARAGEMNVDLGGVQLKVSGPGVVLVVSPGSVPQRDSRRATDRG